MDRIAAMQSFVRTVERGSFAAAAAGTGLSATMVGNHVRFLEARLGARLLNRTTRRQGLTEVGRAYYERCRQILAEIEAAEARAAEAQAAPRGLLRVTAPVVVGTTVLPRLLAEYLRLHPQVRVDLVLQDRRVDLLEEGLDAAIRAGSLPDSGLIARALAPLQLVVCAAPAYLAARGAPGTPADLAAHECLPFAHAAEPGAWRFTGPEGPVAVAVGGKLLANNSHAIRVAALEGIGVAMLPDVLVADDLAGGRLVRLLPDHAAPSLPLHLLTLPDRHPTPQLRSFVEGAAQRLGPAAARRPRAAA
ncbi:MAG: LysR family transcriptional regulator [Acetobacteraceae bacterium]|nr:LysR family transcriptional regulator [Acetobacteraceae bacterium]